MYLFSLKRTDDVEKQTRYQFFDIWDVDQYFLPGLFCIRCTLRIYQLQIIFICENMKTCFEKKPD